MIHKHIILKLYIALLVIFSIQVPANAENELKYEVITQVSLEAFNQKRRGAKYRTLINKRNKFLQANSENIPREKKIVFLGQVNSGIGGFTIEETNIDNTNDKKYFFSLSNIDLINEVDKAFASSKNDYIKTINLEKRKSLRDKFDTSLVISFSSEVIPDEYIPDFKELYSRLENSNSGFNSGLNDGSFNEDYIWYSSYLRKITIEKSSENPNLVTVKGNIFDSLPIPKSNSQIIYLWTRPYLKGNFEMTFIKASEFDFQEELRKTEANEKPKGKGTINNPFKIENCVDLQKLNRSYNSTHLVHDNLHIELLNDIDCSETKNWHDGEGFPPIRFFYTHGLFHFDGRGHKISGLYMNRNSEAAIFELIGSLKGAAEIKNLTLENINISGENSVAVFANEIGRTNFTNVKITGNINLKTVDWNYQSERQNIARNSLAIIANSASPGLKFNNIDIDVSLKVNHKLGSISADVRAGGLISTASITVDEIDKIKEYPILVNNANIKVNFDDGRGSSSFGYIVGRLFVSNRTNNTFTPLEVYNTNISGSVSRIRRQSDLEDFETTGYYIGDFYDGQSDNVGPVELIIENSNSNIDEVGF